MSRTEGHCNDCDRPLVTAQLVGPSTRVSKFDKLGSNLAAMHCGGIAGDPKQTIHTHVDPIVRPGSSQRYGINPSIVPTVKTAGKENRVAR